MVDQPKEPPKGPVDAGEGEEEIELDKTRMDIDVDKSPVGDVTGTDIHIDVGKENTVDEEVGGRFEFIGKLWRKFLEGIKSLKGKASRPSTKEPKSYSPFLSSFVGLWIAPPELSILGKSLFYLSRLLILVGGIVLLAILGESVADSFETGSPFSWVLLGVAVFAGFLSIISIFLRWHACWFIGSPLIAILLLLVLHTFFFQTTDPFFLSLKDKPPAFVFNQVWLLIIFFELLLILFVYPRFWPFLILLAVLCLYGLAGFGLNFYKGVPLEASWEGVSVLSYIPLVILQPTFASLHFVVLFLFFVNLIFILFFREKLAAAQWIGMNLVILLLVGALGLITLQNNRIPNILTLFTEPPLELGLVEIEDQGRVVSLKTANYDTIKNHDTMGHYRLKLLPRGASKKGESKEYYLSAINASGFPVLYLTKSEFILTVDEKLAPQWSITSLSQSERPSKKITKEQTPQYVLSVKFPDLGPQFEIKLPKRGAEFSQSQSLEFSLSPESSLAESYEVVVDEKSTEKKEDLGDERDFDFPLSDLSEGKHFVEITLKGKDGSAVVRSQEINILPPLSVVIEAPMEGDYFGDELSVLARVSGPAGLVVSDVRFIVDDQELFSKSLPPYRTNLDTSQLSMGRHQLKVIARVKEDGEEKEFRSQVEIFKGPYSKISFKRPTLGEFVSFETPIEVSVSDEGKYSTVELFLDGKQLHKWNAPPYTYTWNTSELTSGDYLLRVQGKTEEGVKSSDSVRVSTGEGMLNVQTQSQRRGRSSAGFRYRNVVFVLDASISQWDSWNLESKWEWVKKVFSLKEVTSKLKGIKVGVITSGGSTPFDHHNCSDAEMVYSLDSFNSRKIIKVLDEKKPTGVSALFAGVEKALEKKPQKIIVLTGGADSCYKKISSDLATKLGKSGVHLDVVTLGALEEDETKTLEALVKFGFGNLIVVNKPDELEEKIAKVLTLYYEVFAGNKLILSAPVDGKPLPLRPGEYLLKISMNPPLEDQKITIRNGLTTDLKIIVGGEKVEVKEEFAPAGQK